ncbi:hypothetical protein RSOL_525880, partial [Rhizoctonia solani AG-3 Rhs1AP]
MSEYETSQATFEIFEQPQRLPGILKAWKQVMKAKEWDMVIEKFLPTKEESRVVQLNKAGVQKQTYLQGIADSTWYKDWVRLITAPELDQNEPRQTEIVEFARKILHEKAKWLPMGASDRLWSDVKGGKSAIFGDLNVGRFALVVVFNPRVAPCLM